MKRVLGIAAALAGLGAAAWWVKKNVTVDISKDAETPEETAELDAAEAAAEAKTEAELKDAQGSAFKTVVALVKGWARRHVAVTVTPDAAEEPDEEPEEEPTEEVYTTPAAPAGAPVEEAAASAPAGESVPAGESTPAAPIEDGPNPNPVEAAPAAAPVDEDGKLDATALASPEDFADWEQHGCRG